MNLKDKANTAGKAVTNAAIKVAALPVPGWMKLVLIFAAGVAAAVTGTDALQGVSA